MSSDECKIFVKDSSYDMGYDDCIFPIRSIPDVIYLILCVVTCGAFFVLFKKKPSKDKFTPYNLFDKFDLSNIIKHHNNIKYEYDEIYYIN